MVALRNDSSIGRLLNLNSVDDITYAYLIIEYVGENMAQMMNKTEVIKKSPMIIKNTTHNDYFFASAIIFIILSCSPRCFLSISLSSQLQI